jgi:hypothetical protein
MTKSATRLGKERKTLTTTKTHAYITLCFVFLVLFSFDPGFNVSTWFIS